jgi:amidophosphoribosyltransferase
VDRFVDMVGLCAVAGVRDAAGRVSRGLDALGHRGSVRRSIAASEHLGASTSDVAAPLGPLRGPIAIGEVHGWPAAEGLGSETGGERLVVGRIRDRWVAVALSGRLTNGAALRRELLEAGAVLQTRADAEVLLHLVATSAQRRLVNRVVDALWRVEGAYALLVLTADLLVAVRDPAGFRPLVLGRIGDAGVVATEDAAIRAAGGEVRRALHPGEMVVLDGRGVQSVSPFPGRPPTACVQEELVLAAPDAAPFGRTVHDSRAALGERLAATHPCPGADLVCGVPGWDGAAVAYARAAGLPYEPALLPCPAEGGDEPIEPIEPIDRVEPIRVTRWRAIGAAVKDRVVVLVAPTLTTGRALAEAVTTLRRAGAAAVHLRVACPPVRAACPYGVACPTPEELWVHRMIGGGGAAALGAASVDALTLSDIRQLLGTGDPQVHGLCDACLSGERPLHDRPEDQLPLF